jgi:hypothetical protein
MVRLITNFKFTFENQENEIENRKRKRVQLGQTVEFGPLDSHARASYTDRRVPLVSWPIARPPLSTHGLRDPTCQFLPGCVLYLIPIAWVGSLTPWPARQRASLLRAAYVADWWAWGLPRLRLPRTVGRNGLAELGGSRPPEPVRFDHRSLPRSAPEPLTSLNPQTSIAATCERRKEMDCRRWPSFLLPHRLWNSESRLRPSVGSPFAVSQWS